MVKLGLESLFIPMSNPNIGRLIVNGFNRNVNLLFEQIVALEWLDFLGGYNKTTTISLYKYILFV